MTAVALSNYCAKSAVKGSTEYSNTLNHRYIVIHGAASLPDRASGGELPNNLQKQLSMGPKLFSIAVFADMKSGSSVFADFIVNEIGLISVALNHYMEENKPFLRMRYNIRDLGDDLGVPSNQLSTFINQCLGISFRDYLNRLRINYCRQLVENGRVEHYNMHGLAKGCGFANRNTFTKAFKKVTGNTPSVYFKREFFA
jgi:AraC-like DNA-binding protein